MNINIEKLIELNELLSLASKRKHKVVLNPAKEIPDLEIIEQKNEDIVLDKNEWKIPMELQDFANQLSENKELSNEDKILAIFDKLCKCYIYDDNVLSYIKKVDEEDFRLPDWYGRNITPDWEKNRENHNRRVCYEVSRYLAESLNEVFKNNDDYNCCILWDKGLTHYFVGLTCDDYTLTLDVDDFNNIKDLTRLKTDLTIEGIGILSDKQGKFKQALEKFNNERSEHAIKKIENEISDIKSNATENEQSNNSETEPDDIVFLKNAIEILTQKYDIDSSGLFEYMKEVVDIKEGPEARKKVWKKIEGKEKNETRYIRCLLIDVNNQKYLIDVDKKIIRTFDEKEFLDDNSEFIPYKKLSRDWGEYYNGK